MLQIRHLSLCPSMIMTWLVAWGKSTPSNTIQEQSSVVTTNINHNDLWNDIKNINWKPIEKESDVNKALKNFNAKVSEVFDRHARTIQKNVKRRPCKWLTRELKKEINNRDRQLRKARKSSSENDWSSYKRLRNRCNTLIRKAKTHYQNLLTENETNLCQFWNAIKEIYRTKLKPVGSVTTNKKDSKSTV